MKIIVIIAFLLILFSLAKALQHLVKHKSDADSEKTMQALMVRSGISVLLFVILFLAVASGLIKPHGLGVKMQHPNPPASQRSQ
jgi:hypothetical protein